MTIMMIERAIIWISLLIRHVIWSREYGLLFEHERSYVQTGYLTLCDECAVKVEVMINRWSGVVMYAENRVRGVSLVVYFERPGVYANVTDGTQKYNIPLTLDFFSSEWFGWHDLELQISETRMQITFGNSVRQTALKGRFLFPEDIVEENEIYFGTSPRWPGIKNVTGFQGLMKNFMYKSCGCDEWRSMEMVTMVGVSTAHLGDCGQLQACKEDCSCYLFPWGGKRCECPDLQCLQKSNDVSYDFDRFSLNLGRLQKHNISHDVKLSPGIIGDAMIVNEKSSLVLFVATGRSCFKNIYLCEKGFTHSFWILPQVTSQMESSSLILKHASTLESTYGLTVTRVGNRIQATLVTHDGTQFIVQAPLQLGIWCLVTTIYNRTHFSLFQNAYLKQSSTSSTKITHKFPEVTSTRFLFVGNNKDNPDAHIDNFNFTYNVHMPRLPSIQELRLEQHGSLRKTNYDCEMVVDQSFVDLTKCYQKVFRDSTFSEFYLSLIFSLQMEKNRMILVQSPFINVTSELYTTLHIDVRGEATRAVKLKLVASRLYYVEISMTSDRTLTVRQNVHTVLLNVTLWNYGLGDHKSAATMFLVHKDRNAVADLRFMNVDRDFAKKARRIITGDVVMYAVDFDHNNFEDYPKLQLSEGYIDQGIMLRYPSHHVSSNWFKGACLRYVAACYHGFTVAFWMKIINNFQQMSDPFFRVFSSGDRGISLLIGKEGLYFVVVVDSQSVTKFVPGPVSFELYQWCQVELTVSPSGIVSLFLNGREAQRVADGTLTASYKCSRICLREENDKETSVAMIIDEIKTWNVERDFLYANGYLSSDTQSLMQQHKNQENKIKQLKAAHTSLQSESKKMKNKVRDLEVEVDKLKAEIKSIICGKVKKNKTSNNYTLPTTVEGSKSKLREMVNDVFIEPKKLKCSDETISVVDISKYFTYEGSDGANRTEEVKEPKKVE